MASNDFLHSDGDKQAGHGWGENTAAGELDDETTGLADARKEEKEGIVVDDTPVDENGAPIDQTPAEPEDNSKSYEQYLAEQLEKKAALNDRPLEVRKANEGSTKKFPEGTAVTRDTENEDFFVGGGGKKGRARDRKEKATLDIDQAWVEQETSQRGGSFRGGRGAGRGRGEGRGEGRGGRGGARGGRGGERGSFRGGESRGGAPRGGRGGAGSGPNISNSTDFPTLGK